MEKKKKSFSKTMQFVLAVSWEVVKIILSICLVVVMLAGIVGMVYLIGFLVKMATHIVTTT